MNGLLFVILMLLFSGIGLKKRKQLTIPPEPLNKDVSVSTKGIASIIVILVHTSLFCSENKGIPSMGFIAVALFFFWSGYGMTRGYETNSNYLKGFPKKYSIKLLLPLLIATVLYLSTDHFFNISVNISGFADFLTKWSSGDIVPFCWYVWALVMFCAVFYIVNSLKLDKNKRFALLCAIIILITVIEWRFFKKGFWCYSNIAFLAGAAIYLYDREMKYRKWYLMLSPILFLISYVSFPGFKMIFGFYSEPIRVLSNNFCSLFAVMFVLSVLSYIGKPNRIAKFLGTISFEIYLYHGLVMQILNKLGVENGYLFFALSVILTVAVAYPMHKFDAYLISRLLKPHKKAEA